MTTTNNINNVNKINKYGYQGSGEYLTPYEHTIVYDSDDVFQTAVAVCAYRPQPCANNTIPTYVTPKIIIFTANESKIKEYLSVGYQCVIVVSNDHVVESDKVVKADSSNFHDVIALTSGITCAYLMELVLVSQYDNYISERISKQDAYDFKLALDRADALWSYTSWDGIQKCEDTIRLGQCIRRYREKLASKSLAAGAFYKDSNDITLYVINEREFRFDVLTMAKTHLMTASADIIIVYHIDYAKKSYVVTILPRGNHDAIRYGKSVSDCVWNGNERIAHGEIPLDLPSPLPWAEFNN